MPQTPPEISDARAVPTPSSTADPAIDPLLKLHKMSTTAGVGSGDYVAVNATSIVAILLGIASLLAMFEPMLLILPAIGVIVSILSLRQIGQSNGTQTGRALAFGGLALSVVIGGLVGFKQLTERSRANADRAEIEQIIVQLGNDVRDGKPADAYEKLGARFKEQVPKELFVAIMTSARANDRFGTLQGISSIYDPSKPGLVVFETNTTTGERIAVASGLMKFNKLDEPMRQSMNFRQAGGKWELDAMPELFPKQGPDGPGGPGGPPGGPQSAPGAAPPGGVQGPPMQ